MSKESVRNQVITHEFLLTLEDNYHEWLKSSHVKLIDVESCGEFYISVRLNKLSSLDVKVSKTIEKSAMAIIELRTNGMNWHVKDVPNWKDFCNFDVDFPYYYLQYSNNESDDNFKFYLSIKCKITWFGFKDEMVFSNLYQSMKQFLHSIECSDVIIMVKNREFPTHKNILTSQSPVLKSLLTTTDTQYTKKLVRLRKIEVDVAEELFLFLYTGKVNKANHDYDLAVKLLVVAKNYQIIPLINLCGLILSNSITKENALQLLKLSESRKTDNVFILQERATAFIWNNRKEILTLENFKDPSKFSPESLFKIIEKIPD
ncbi:TD and POZ domain-containing protein 1-like [Cotesia typhae]|uniref:TD and POZ domain-containing protein 1-like n=1 Tax=Cotesia typhae TaxID=2053667 RepID=UPI003D6839FA